jgi:hypothetical protein
MVSHRWMRSATLVLSAAVLGLVVAPAAQATDITNPAEHPDPITLTIDGQTYRDGADTLPGYDDYACTPIPNVQYDFADDQIQYYDGQGELIKTAHWTEWSRISSYDTWVSQQHAGSPSSSPTSAPSSADATPAATSTTTTSTATTSPAAAAAPAATGPANASPVTKTPSAASKTKGPATTTKATRTAAEAKSSARTRHASRGTTSKTPRAASAPAKKRGKPTASRARHGSARNRTAAAASPGANAPAGGTSTAASSASPSGVATSAQGNAAPSSTPSAANTPKFKLVSDKGVEAGVANTRPIGVGILVAVFGVACLAFLFGSAKRRSFGRVTS